MALTPVLLSRVTNELNMLVKSPPPGVSCWPVGDSMTEFEAGSSFPPCSLLISTSNHVPVIIGAEDTPYELGEFKISLVLPMRYPIEPPRCLFKTKIWHPNVDEGGRICLDILNPPPKGSWKPSLNIATVLTSLRLLLSNPNPEDPLVGHISDQYVADYDSFVRNAKAYTQKYAMPNQTVPQPATTNPSPTTSSAPLPQKNITVHATDSTEHVTKAATNEKKRKSEESPQVIPIDESSTTDAPTPAPEAKKPKLKEEDAKEEAKDTTKSNLSSTPSLSASPSPSTVSTSSNGTQEVSSRPAIPKSGVKLGLSKKVVQEEKFKT